MRYHIETVSVLHGLNLPVPRYYIRGPLRTFRAGSISDAEYLASILNNMTDEQHDAALNAATEEDNAKAA